MPLPAPDAPAGYIPYHALTFTAADGHSVAAGPVAPLPTEAKIPPSGVTALAGSTAVSAVLGPFAPALGRAIWLSLSGIWAGSAVLKRSVDGGTTKLPLTAGGLAWGAFTGNCCEPVAEESEAGAAWYLDVTLVSGTLAYRVAQ